MFEKTKHTLVNHAHHRLINNSLIQLREIPSDCGAISVLRAETESLAAANWLTCILLYQQDQGCLLKLPLPTACRVSVTVQALLKAKQTSSSAFSATHTVVICYRQMEVLRRLWLPTCNEAQSRWL